MIWYLNNAQADSYDKNKIILTRQQNFSDLIPQADSYDKIILTRQQNFSNLIPQADSNNKIIF